MYLRIQEDLANAKSQINELFMSKSDQMGALSQQLLDDKNAEIDELRQQISMLQSDDKDASYQLVRILNVLKYSILNFC